MNTAETILVSIHIPKTGGSTLLAILQQVYGDRLQLAYGDDRDKSVERPLCYHGHAVLDSYGDLVTNLPGARWLTFLRDPVRSAISLFHYGVKRGTVQEIDLCKWLTGKEKFCWPNPPNYNHNRFSKWIARAKLSWDGFDFIGITELFDKSVRLLSAALDWPAVQYAPENVGTYGEPVLPDSIVGEFKCLNADDYRVYNRALNRLQSQQSV